MLGWAALCTMTLWFYSEQVWGQGECTDLRGQLISHGLHYVPGPDTCTLCVCDNGLPKVCKAVLCSPPQDCRSFRVGNTCCEFICLDDVVKPPEGAEANVRLAAGGAAAVVLLTVALVVYRVRKQKRRRPPHADDQRSLTSIGYISGSMGYMGGTCETALAAWKPGGPYLPRGEAPPPYDEAMAQCRPDALSRPNEAPYHRTYPASVEAMPRPDDQLPCQGHSYANIPRPIQQMANPQNCYNAPLLQPAHESREPNPMPHHPLAPSMVGFPSAIRLTGSLGAISNRGLLSVLQREPEPQPERPHHVPGFYPHPHPHTALHRTIPRISTTIESALLDAALSAGGGCGGGGGGGAVFARADRSQPADPRRSFHKPAPDARADRDAATGRSMPRNLNLVSADTAPAHPHPHSHPHRHAPHGPRHDPLVDSCNIRVSASGVNASTNTGVGPGRRADPDGSECVKPPPPPAPATAPSAATSAAPPAATPAPAAAPCPPHQTLPLTVDKPSCVCSYACVGGGGGSAGGAGGGGEGGGGHPDGEGEGEDDFRSECENCKAATNSRWAVSEGWEGEEEDGTQTLQRRAPPPAPPPPATATLPQPVSKPRGMLGPSNWENWFNTIPDSDTESEEE